DELIMPRERHRHRIGICLPRGSRPLDVGEKKRDSSHCRLKLLWHRHFQFNILCNYRGLEPFQIWPRVDAQLFGEQCSCPLIGTECLALPAGAIKREHELTPTSLAQWGLGDSGSELADDLRP